MVEAIELEEELLEMLLVDATKPFELLTGLPLLYVFVAEDRGLS